MPNFQYVATDQTGAQTQGTFEAANEQQAYEQLAQYGLNVSQVVPLDPPASSGAEGNASKKSKGKGKKGPKGGCYTCGGDHYASDCTKTGKGNNVKVLTLCPITKIPLHNRYADLEDEDSDWEDGEAARSDPGELETSCPSEWKPSLRRTEELKGPKKRRWDCRETCLELESDAGDGA